MTELSPLPKTWLLDVDGTIVKHNGYKTGGDVLLDGVKEFFARIAAEDKVIFLTARPVEEKENLENFLRENGLRHDLILFDIPVGERILVNDRKPSGLATAYAVNKDRDTALKMDFSINEKL